MNNLGKKIVVIGVSASGKSTFARKLAEKTNLPLVLVDAIIWKPGWQYIGDEEYVKKLKEIGIQNEWLIEGYIEKDARQFIFDRADTIIYLDYPRIVASFRYIKRCLQYRKTPRPELTGCLEKFDFDFLKRVWYKRELVSVNKFLGQMDNQDKVIKLTSIRQTKAFLKS